MFRVLAIIFLVINTIAALMYSQYFGEFDKATYYLVSAFVILYVWDKAEDWL